MHLSFPLPLYVAFPRLGTHNFRLSNFQRFIEKRYDSQIRIISIARKNMTEQEICQQSNETDHIKKNKDYFNCKSTFSTLKYLK